MCLKRDVSSNIMDRHFNLDSLSIRALTASKRNLVLHFRTGLVPCN